MGHAYQYTVPPFSDRDGDPLLLRASQAGAGSALPGWLAFDEPTSTLSGTPPRVGERVAVHVTATDEDMLAAGDLPCDPDRAEAGTEMNPPRLCATVTFELSVVANQPPVAPELTEILFEPAAVRVSGDLRGRGGIIDLPGRAGRGAGAAGVA